MGGIESQEQEEVEYNHLQDQVKEWDGEVDSSQMQQIESFHKTIINRSQGSQLIIEKANNDDENDDNMPFYQDPKQYMGNN